MIILNKIDEVFGILLYDEEDSKNSGLMLVNFTPGIYILIQAFARGGETGI